MKLKTRLIVAFFAIIMICAVSVMFAGAAIFRICTIYQMR